MTEASPDETAENDKIKRKGGNAVESSGAMTNWSIELDKYSRTPIYEQVVEQFKKQILTGGLQADDPLPSVRSLSVELGVNPNTLQKAYTELDRQKLSYTVAGNGRFVHPDARITLQESETTVLYESLREITGRLRTAGQSREQILQKLTELLESK